MRLWIITLILALRSTAATYYIATTGDDGNVGSAESPWLTATHAATNTTAGDTVLIQPGVYDQKVWLRGGGTSGTYVTYLANGSVTNLGTWNVISSNIVIDGFHFTLQGSNVNSGSGVEEARSAIAFAYTNAHYVVVRNCIFHDTHGLYGTSGVIQWTQMPTTLSNGCSNITITNNTFTNCPALQISMHGATNTVINNWVSNTFGGDFIHPWGHDHRIAGNVVADLGATYAQVVGAGNADFNSVYYLNTNLMSAWSSWHLLVYTNPACALVHGDDHETYGFSNTITLVKLDNSVTYASVVGAWSSSWTVHDAGIVSAPTDVKVWVDHPDFVQVWGPLQNNPESWGLESYNITIEGNNMQGSLATRLTPDHLGQICQCVAQHGTNTATIHDWTWRNNVFRDFGNASVDVANTKWHNNTFWNCGTIAFGWYVPTNATASERRGEPYGCEVYNNAFLVGDSGAAASGWYAWNCGGSYTNPTQWGGADFDLATNCNFNYVCNSTNGWTGKTAGTSWGGSVFKFYEPNGINGGNPGMWNVGANECWLTNGALLVNRGTNISTVTTDCIGTTRPLGGTNDIGAFECDPNLLMKLDFGQGVAGGKVVDVTGKNHHAWRMDATNWISTASGPNGLTAGKWAYAFDMTNDPPNCYHASQYGAITNIAGLEKLTNGTICVWVKWDTNVITDSRGTNQALPERWDMILDAGDMPRWAGDPSISSNSFYLGYGYVGMIPAGPIFRVYPYDSWDTDTNFTYAYWSDQTRSQNNWWHISVAWTGGANLIAYQNGIAWSTNPLAKPYLEVGGKTNTPWIVLGALQHSGTPQWGDDKHPNAGFFKGLMADVRLYDRELSASEVANIYSANGRLLAGDNEAPASRTHRVSTLNVGSLVRP